MSSGQRRRSVERLRGGYSNRSGNIFNPLDWLKQTFIDQRQRYGEEKPLPPKPRSSPPPQSLPPQSSRSLQNSRSGRSSVTPPARSSGITFRQDRPNASVVAAAPSQYEQAVSAAERYQQEAAKLTEELGGEQNIRAIAAQTSAPGIFFPENSNQMITVALPEYYKAQDIVGGQNFDPKSALFNQERFNQIANEMNFDANMRAWAQANPALAQREYAKMMAKAGRQNELLNPQLTQQELADPVSWIQSAPVNAQAVIPESNPGSWPDAMPVGYIENNDAQAVIPESNPGSWPDAMPDSEKYGTILPRSFLRIQ